MKTIGSFKLHKGGEAGIEISSQQLTKNFTEDDNGITGEVYHDDVSTFRKESTPRHILDEIVGLKYFLLKITGYWLSIYDNYFDFEKCKLDPFNENSKESRKVLQTIWENISVTQVEMTAESFTIRGLMEVIEKKPLALNPSKITATDDQDYYEDARMKITRVFSLLVAYFSTAAISDIDDYRKYLLSHADETAKVAIAAYDEHQIVNSVVDRFAKDGLIVMMDGELSETPAIGNSTQGPKDDAPTADFEPEPGAEEDPEDIDQAAYEESIKEEMKDDEEWPDDDELNEPAMQPDKAKDPFGNPAAEDGKSEVPSEESQYSANVGSGDIDDEGPSDLDDLPAEDFE